MTVNVIVKTYHCLEGSSMNSLIVYGTRYSSTKATIDEIARILHEENINVNTANAKEEKIESIVEYGLVVVGSGMALGNWVGEVEDFVKKIPERLGKQEARPFLSLHKKPVEEKAGRTLQLIGHEKCGWMTKS